MRNVCVYAASKDVAPSYHDAAYCTGQLLAAAGWGIVCGGGSVGLMRALSDGALDNGGEVRGVLPQFMIDAKLQYDRLTEVISTPTMHERKATMVAMSTAAVALPGGYGTLDELAEIITWRQLHIVEHPVVILNTNGYFDELIAWIEHGRCENFIDDAQEPLWKIAETPEQIMELLSRSVIPNH